MYFYNIMKNTGFKQDYGVSHQRRFDKTLTFMDGLISKTDKILDLGPANPFGKILQEKGYQIENTPLDVDLDLNPETVCEKTYDVMTAFEIFEHLVSPFPILRNVKANKLFASVPLKLWFAEAYWNEDDIYDRHYHEFESRQFDMLVEKAGWTIIKKERWKNPSGTIGIRPILRKFTSRHYIVYCERK